jgi:hypothetical protein
MKTRSIVALAAVAGLAAGASAQVISTAGITANLGLTWIEDPSFSHNDNGVLEPGEHALIVMAVSFAGQNTTASFSPGIGTFTSGLVLGLGSAYVDIRSAAGDASGLYNGGVTVPASTSVGPNNTGGTTGYGVRNPWRLGGNVANGTQGTPNGFQNVGPGQLPTDPSVANSANPIPGMERLGWAPNSYAQRTQTFTVSGAVGTNNNVVGLYLDLDGSVGNPGQTGAAAYLLTSAISFGSVNIPLAPAPSSLALLGLGGLVAGRRRR